MDIYTAMEESYNNGYAKGCEDSKPKWISVEERLPEQDSKFLVHRNLFGDSYVTTASFAKDGRKVDRYDFRRRWKNVWYEYDREVGYFTVDVTHWMPLPEPPKEVKHG